MTTNQNSLRRIMLAITETSSLQDLWAAAMEHLEDTSTEVITLFVSDDRWRRAASLPFTREISRVGGGVSEFTLQRAEQVDKDAVVRAQGRLRKLAADAKIRFAFEILDEREATRIHELVRSELDVLIAPSVLKARPIYAELSRMKCRILLIDTREVLAPSQDD